ncbi:MAG: RluA family pseudouridine synthase [Oscillospiraceae bacterium]
MKSFKITENDSGQRVDKFLTKAAPLLPKSMLYKAIRTKNIKLNRKRCEIGTRLEIGDVLDVYLPDEVFETDSKNEFMHSGRELDIIYEDGNILLVNKPVGLVVHEDDEHTMDTLINRILLYLYEKGEYLPDGENSFVPSLCNRIDRNTCGIVIAAKNAQALREMNDIIKRRLIKKQYLCLTEGCPSPESATVQGYITKDSAAKSVVFSDRKTPGSKTAVTKYRVVKKSEEMSLVEVTLITGRTHQIRAHFAYMGHPLIGDGKYGNNAVGKRLGIKHQALCSYKLTFCLGEYEGILSYIDKKTFKIGDIWFLSLLK